MDGESGVRRFWPVLLALALGLATRPLGRVAHWLSDPLGDVLYAVFLSRLVRLFWPKIPAHSLALGVFLTCTAIELGQLVQTPWLVAIRRTRLGGLVLGTGFSPTDILCYAVGAALGWLYDAKAFRTRSPET